MDTCLPDWNTDVGGEFPLPLEKKPIGLENELVELLWQNGEIVLHSQTNRKQSKQSRDPNPSTLIQGDCGGDDETVSWIDCPIDESFEREFCANFLSDFDESSKGEKGLKIGDDFAPAPPLPPPPPPRFRAAEAVPGRSQECSGMTVGSSHCASNHVANEVDMISASRRINEGVERERLGQARTSCSGGSGSSSLWKTSSVSNETRGQKRKSRRDVEESECCPSDATESESGAGNKAKSNGSGRRSRVAEVHNMSERRRRDRINEKMKALQELIPHANKSDKASMLDEAIEYMKSLQLQIQLMWMGRGMAPMMLPGVQHYMSRVGMGIGPTMLPGMHNLMRLSRLPVVDSAPSQAPVGHNPMMNPVNYPNQMLSSSFQEQYANYMNFHSMQNASPQATNMFNFGFHPAQQNQVSAPRGNGNASVG